MIKIGYLLFLVPFFFLSVNCNTNKITDDINSEIFPADKGFEWTYINDDVTQENRQYTMRVTGIQKTENGKIAEFNIVPFFENFGSVTKTMINDDGSVFLIKGNDNLMLIPPADELKKDHKWNFDQWTGYVEFTDGNLNINGKDIKNIVKINYALSITYSVELWLAKGYGIVKWGSYRTNPPTLNISYYVLKNFKH